MTRRKKNRRFNESAYVNRGVDANRSEWLDEEDARNIAEAMKDPAEGLTFHLPEGSLPWDTLKAMACTKEVMFQVKGIPATFYLGPDIFDNSYRLAWITHEEVRTNTYLDNRVRSSHMDDFLNRFRMIRDG